jgi:hypothetical protein
VSKLAYLAKYSFVDKGFCGSCILSGSSVSIVTELCAGRQEFDSRQGLGYFFSLPPRHDRL